MMDGAMGGLYQSIQIRDMEAEIAYLKAEIEELHLHPNLDKSIVQFKADAIREMVKSKRKEIDTSVFSADMSETIRVGITIALLDDFDEYANNLEKE